MMVIKKTKGRKQRTRRESDWTRVTTTKGEASEQVTKRMEEQKRVKMVKRQRKGRKQGTRRVK